MKSREQNHGLNSTAKELRAAELVQSLPVEAQRIHSSAITSDHGKLNHINTYGSLPDYYIDIPFRCRKCNARQIWKARDQKWYFEEAKGHIDAKAIHCHDCRQRSPN